MPDRPYVLASAACSLDGCLDDTSGRRLVLSNAADLDRVDEVRAGVDAILVGAGTLRADDPRELDADVVLLAVTLAEVVRGVARDAGHNRVIKAADVWPADEPIARRAGHLLDRAASDATIDALVAATAIALRDRNGSAHCIVLTSDPDDLAALLSEEPGVRVVPI